MEEELTIKVFKRLPGAGYKLLSTYKFNLFEFYTNRDLSRLTYISHYKLECFDRAAVSLEFREHHRWVTGTIIFLDDTDRSVFVVDEKMLYTIEQHCGLISAKTSNDYLSVSYLYSPEDTLGWIVSLWLQSIFEEFRTISQKFEMVFREKRLPEAIQQVCTKYLLESKAGDQKLDVAKIYSRRERIERLLIELAAKIAKNDLGYDRPLELVCYNGDSIRISLYPQALEAEISLMIYKDGIYLKINELKIARIIQSADGVVDFLKNTNALTYWSRDHATLPTPKKSHAKRLIVYRERLTAADVLALLVMIVWLVDIALTRVGYNYITTIITPLEVYQLHIEIYNFDIFMRGITVLVVCCYALKKVYEGCEV
jgi:hypothetical protein